MRVPAMVGACMSWWCIQKMLVYIPMQNLQNCLVNYMTLVTRGMLSFSAKRDGHLVQLILMGDIDCTLHISRLHVQESRF